MGIILEFNYVYVTFNLKVRSFVYHQSYRNFKASLRNFFECKFYSISSILSCLVNTRKNAYSAGRQLPKIPYDKYFYTRKSYVRRVLQNRFF